MALILIHNSAHAPLLHEYSWNPDLCPKLSFIKEKSEVFKRFPSIFGRNIPLVRYTNWYGWIVYFCLNFESGRLTCTSYLEKVQIFKCLSPCDITMQQWWPDYELHSQGSVGKRPLIWCLIVESYYRLITLWTKIIILWFMQWTVVTSDITVGTS